MASVVFMRGVNVGGHQAFRPSALAKAMADFGVTNVGAAGTFVVRTTIRPAALRAEFLRKLPFKPELMIYPASELLDLVESDPFRGATDGKDVRRFVTVLLKPLRVRPRFPIERPEGNEWNVRIIGASGPMVLSLWRRLGKRLIYPNEVVEKTFGMPATTRSWNTVLAIRGLLVE